MRLAGAAAPCAGPLLAEVAEAVHCGRPVLVWSDGQDVAAVIAGENDTAADLLRWAPRLIPGLPS